MLRGVSRAVAGILGLTLLHSASGVAAEPGVSMVIFVERCRGGCTLTPGNDDARFNTTSLVSDQVLLSEFPHGDPIWEETIDCLREVFAPYNVSITTTDPGLDAHHEVILAGTSQEAGYPADVRGIGLLAADCSPLDNVISLVFAGSIGADARQLCTTAAQEIGHAFGLDHAYDCHAVMTHLPGCGLKYFRDRDFPCGESFQRECRCTGNTQNAHQKLTEVLGVGTLPEPPALQIDVAADGGMVEAGFPVVARAQHRRGIDRVELLFNGWLWDTLPGSLGSDEQELAFSASSRLPDGTIDIEVVAYNDLGAPASRGLTVVKGRPGSSADQCAVGQLCEDGRCFWPPPQRSTGDPCDFDEECVSLWCASIGGEQRCSEPCEDDGCERGFECLDSEAGALCWPAADRGCSASGRQGGPSWALLVILVASVFRPRRPGVVSGRAVRVARSPARRPHRRDRSAVQWNLIRV